MSLNSLFDARRLILAAGLPLALTACEPVATAEPGPAAAPVQAPAPVTTTAPRRTAPSTTTQPAAPPPPAPHSHPTTESADVEEDDSGPGSGSDDLDEVADAGVSGGDNAIAGD